LLKILALGGCIVTIEAVGWQKEIAATIVEQGGDYVLALKGNQDNLPEEVKQFFEHAKVTDFCHLPFSFHEILE
jgi:predicted transposase YbfD/YdcC